ncbi:hypothetical protein CDAR_195081 [Caerostris darwini]|uniref:Uncharacterized protein n=1 Tax=Caerostris darwini TaxID=1538125 RepID=A0AAV4X751_9ARAC|nr:hypothetical protein CDAR_195081 [Caerostris darwini]
MECTKLVSQSPTVFSGPKWPPESLVTALVLNQLPLSRRERENQTLFLLKGGDFQTQLVHRPSLAKLNFRHLYHFIGLEDCELLPGCLPPTTNCIGKVGCGIFLPFSRSLLASTSFFVLLLFPSN